MKIDVVVCCFQQGRFLHRVLQGLHANREHINRVIFSNDGLWGVTGFGSGPGPTNILSAKRLIKSYFDLRDVVLLEAPSEGFGLSKAANRGLAAAVTKHVLLIEGDEMLAPDSIAESLDHAANRRLLCARKHYIDLQYLATDAFTVIETDHRAKWPKQMMLLRPWAFCSGGHLLIDREFHAHMGGFDPEYGYGCHDFDYAVRWIDHGGSVVYGGGLAYHIGTGKGRPTPVESRKRFVRTLAAHKNHRYNIACGNRYNPTYVNVDFYEGSSADVLLDCTELDWIPDGSADEILCEHFIEHLTLSKSQNFIETVSKKLRLGGRLILKFPDLRAICQRLFDTDMRDFDALEALYGDQVGIESNPGMSHRWAWDLKGMMQQLEKAGLTIEDSGPDPNSTYMAWRDVQVIAVREEDSDV